MKIVILTGSPHEKGTSAKLAEEFKTGAEESGNYVQVFNTAFEDVHPCLGCDYCLAHEGSCIYQDSMTKIKDAVLEAEMIVFVTPMYYFGISAQLKAVIDRFYAFNDKLQSCSKKSILLAACGDNEAWIVDALEAHYSAVCRYLGWEITDILIATGVHYLKDLLLTDYPEKARKMGESIIA